MLNVPGFNLSPSLPHQNSWEINQKDIVVITEFLDAPFPPPLKMGMMKFKLLIFRLLNSNISSLFLARHHGPFVLSASLREGLLG